MILKNEPREAVPSGGFHWLEFLPGFTYCFLPSLKSNSGQVNAFNHMPELIKKFKYCQEIQKVRVFNFLMYK